MALFNEILGVHKKFEVCSEQQLASGHLKCGHLETFQMEGSFKRLPNFLSIFHSTSVINRTLVLLFFAQIFDQIMHQCCSCVSCDHDQWVRFVNFHTCAHRSCSVVFAIQHSGVQL